MVRELIRVEGVDRSFGPARCSKTSTSSSTMGSGWCFAKPARGRKVLHSSTRYQNNNKDVGYRFCTCYLFGISTQIRDIESDSSIEEELEEREGNFQELEDEIAAIEAQMVDPHIL